MDGVVLEYTICLAIFVALLYGIIMDIKLQHYVDSLQELIGFNSSIEHGHKRKGYKKWSDAIPTYFMYEFFTFNNLYNVDWETTCKMKELVFQSESIGSAKRKSELSNIMDLIDFCFSGKKAMGLIELESHMVPDLSREDILEAINEIEPDQDENGSLNIQNEMVYNTIGDFQNAWKRIFDESQAPSRYNREVTRRIRLNDIKSIITLVYKNRCNIFHGVKNIQMLSSNSGEISKSQRIGRNKIIIYTKVLNALNCWCLEEIKSRI